jgi:hypothetical protein
MITVYTGTKLLPTIAVFIKINNDLIFEYMQEHTYIKEIKYVCGCVIGHKCYIHELVMIK